MTFTMSDTKQRIFDESIRLVGNSNFESVSMRDIADAVGIKAASIYNHFASKQEILDYYYAHYRQHIFDTRLPLGEVKRIVEVEDKPAIVDALGSYNHVFDIEDNHMLQLNKIIYERRIHDDTAADLYLHTFNSNVTYIRSALEHGIQAGRFALFSALGYAYAFVSQRTCLTVNQFITRNAGHGPIEESQMRQWLLDSLPMEAD